MPAYIARRLLQTLMILIGISFVTFILLYLVPADPARQIAGRSATAQTVENIREQLGLNLPFYEQYLRYLKGLVQGDLGRSYLQKTEVASLIWSRLPASLLLMAGAIVSELVIGLTMGVVAATRRGSRTDNALMIFSFVGVSAPQFVIGILMLYVFAVKLGWFPIGGYGTFQHMVLPSLTLGLLGAGWYSRMMRSSLLDVLRQDYIRTARAKGLSERKVVYKHGVRSIFSPLTTQLGADIAALLGGALVTEQVFGLQGIGSLAVQSVQTQDRPVIIGVVMLAGFFIVIANLIVDFLYILLDPRIRT